MRRATGKLVCDICERRPPTLLSVRGDGVEGWKACDSCYCTLDVATAAMGLCLPCLTRADLALFKRPPVVHGAWDSHSEEVQRMLAVWPHFDARESILVCALLSRIAESNEKQRKFLRNELMRRVKVAEQRVLRRTISSCKVIVDG